MPGALAVVLFMEAAAQAADKGCSSSLQENWFIEDFSVVLRCGAEAKGFESETGHRNKRCWETARSNHVSFLARNIAPEEEGQPRCEVAREEDMEGVYRSHWRAARVNGGKLRQIKRMSGKHQVEWRLCKNSPSQQPQTIRITCARPNERSCS